MSDQEINIAIAEVCGVFNQPFPRIPDYCQDLNAMHEAEGILTNEQIEVYCSLLQKPQWGIWWAISATASQRAEAFLRTIGKWKEGAK